MVALVIASLTLVGAVLLALYAKTELDMLNMRAKAIEESSRIVVEDIGKRLVAVEGILSDLDVTAETAMKAREQMQRFSDGVASILNYDGGGSE